MEQRSEAEKVRHTKGEMMDRPKLTVGKLHKMCKKCFSAEFQVATSSFQVSQRSSAGTPPSHSKRWNLPRSHSPTKTSAEVTPIGGGGRRAQVSFAAELWRKIPAPTP